MKLTPVVKILVIINVAVFIIGALSGQPIGEYLGLRYFQSELFQPYQILTHFFLHWTFMHLLFNMFGLISFGPVLERLWGGKRFLFYYVFCALGAALLNSGVNYLEFRKMEEAKAVYLSEPSPEYFISFVRATDRSEVENFFQQNNFIEEYEKNPSSEANIRYATENVKQLSRDLKNVQVMGGASGAIFGLLMAFGLLFPNTELMLLFFPFPIKAKYFVLIYAGLELFLGAARFKGDSIAHFAHLGGALFGFILIKYWQKQRNTFY